MDLFTRDDLKTLLQEPRTHCVSVFMPTQRGGGEEAPIRWRVHLGEAQERLVAAGLRAREASAMLGPARRLLEDVGFWKNQGDGLACFLAPEFLRLYRLPLVFHDLVVVGRRFQITPLLPLLSGDGSFYVLALSQNAVRLLHGTRATVSEIHLRSVPKTLADALLTHDKDEPLTFHARPTSGGTWGAVFSGHGVGIDDAKDDLLRYFQKINRGLHTLFREERSPLIVAAVDYLQPIYRQASTYPHLLEPGIAGNPDRLSSKELHDRAWALVKPQFEKARAGAIAQYRQLAPTGRTANGLQEVVPAAYEGRIETLFVVQGLQRWGRFDPDTRQVEEHTEQQPGDEDLLDFAAAYTLLHGRTVYAVEPEVLSEGRLLAGVICLPLAKRGTRP